MKRIQDLLAQIGLESERVRMVNLSSAMSGQFAAVAAEMTEQVTALGPSPLRRAEARPTETGEGPVPPAPDCNLGEQP